MLATAHTLLYTGIALYLLTSTGNWACRLLLSLTGFKDAIAGTLGSGQPAGRIIGGLERLILAAGIVAQSWEVLAAVIALKTVARFKELEHQLPAEYFLVGSLFSVLWAMLITGAWLAYDQALGLDVHHSVAHVLRPAAVAGKP